MLITYTLMMLYVVLNYEIVTIKSYFCNNNNLSLPPLINSITHPSLSKAYAIMHIDNCKYIS